MSCVQGKHPLLSVTGSTDKGQMPKNLEEEHDQESNSLRDNNNIHDSIQSILDNILCQVEYTIEVEPVFIRKEVEQILGDVIDKIAIDNPYLNRQKEDLEEEFVTSLTKFEPDYYHIGITIEALDKTIFNKTYPGMKLLKMRYLKKNVRGKKVWKKDVTDAKYKWKKIFAEQEKRKQNNTHLNEFRKKKENRDPSTDEQDDLEEEKENQENNKEEDATKKLAAVKINGINVVQRKLGYLVGAKKKKVKKHAGGKVKHQCCFVGCLHNNTTSKMQCVQAPVKQEKKPVYSSELSPKISLSQIFTAQENIREMQSFP